MRDIVSPTRSARPSQDRGVIISRREVPAGCAAVTRPFRPAPENAGEKRCCELNSTKFEWDGHGFLLNTIGGLAGYEKLRHSITPYHQFAHEDKPVR